MATPVYAPAVLPEEPLKPQLGPLLAISFLGVGFVCLEVLALALGWVA